MNKPNYGSKKNEKLHEKPLLAVGCFLMNIFEKVKIVLKLAHVLKKNLLSDKDVMHLGNLLT